MTDQDERFFSTSVFRILGQFQDVPGVFQQTAGLLERLFPSMTCEFWLRGPRGEMDRCYSAQGDFTRFQWSSQADLVGTEGERRKLALGSCGYLLLEGPPQAPWLRDLRRCLQSLEGPLALVLDRESQAFHLALQAEQQRKLEAESAWLKGCFEIMGRGQQLLQREQVLSQFVPLGLQAFPGHSLVLGVRRSEGVWEVEDLHGSSWRPQGAWQEIWQTCLKYQRLVHFDSLKASRFAGCFPSDGSLTVAPMPLQSGVLCGYGPPSQLDPAVLRIFALGATWLDYLLHLSRLHGEVRHAYDALQESELRRSQATKLAAIAQIAAGVAHEMNNPLAAIQLTLDRLGREKSLSESLQRSLASAGQAVQRCREVARELLSFSYESKNEVVPECHLMEVVKRSLGLSQEWSRSRGLEIILEEKGEDWRIRANGSQIQEILLHLIENALWASQEKQGKSIWLRIAADRERVRLDVEDQGPGVPEELRERIFDPFFTTRPMGKATGLGLAISRRLAQASGGELELVRTGIEGSVFRLQLPILTAGL